MLIVYDYFFWNDLNIFKLAKYIFFMFFIITHKRKDKKCILPHYRLLIDEIM